jgi:hypothetical protein
MTQIFRPDAAGRAIIPPEAESLAAPFLIERWARHNPSLKVINNQLGVYDNAWRLIAILPLTTTAAEIIAIHSAFTTEAEEIAAYHANARVRAIAAQEQADEMNRDLALSRPTLGLDFVL